MAYIGQSIKNGTFIVLDTSGNTYNGSNTTFSLGTQVGSAAQLLVSHDGVIQKPGTDYTLASGGTQITFTTAPASGASIFIVEISGAVGGTITPSDSSVTSAKLSGNLVTPGTLDVNGQELIIDADGDTSITADTDDQIDVKIGGTDQFSIKDGVIEPTTDNDVDLGSSSKEFKDGYFDGTLHCDTLNLAGTAHTAITGGVSAVETVVITSSGTYTPTSGTQFVTVYCFGAGGGGGNTSGTGNVPCSGGGGGSGGCAIRTYDATELGADASVSIGSGGAGGASHHDPRDGSSGGNTTFNPAGTGSTLTGNGGGGGYGGSNSYWGRGGTGGSASNGQINMDGMPAYVVANTSGKDQGTTRSSQGNAAGTTGMAGGHTIFTRGSLNTAYGSSGNVEVSGAAGAIGCGGQGAAARENYSTAGSGGNGGAGYVVVMEYA